MRVKGCIAFVPLDALSLIFSSPADVDFK